MPFLPDSAIHQTESHSHRGKGRPRTAETAAPSLVDLLNLVRSETATTRQELERASALGRAIVADRLALLGDLGLVDESELGTATGGRAPRLVRFAARRAAILVATLDQTAIGVGVADLSGNLLTEHHEAADLTGPPDQLTDRLAALFRWSLDRHATPAGVWGISLSVPGAVQSAQDGAFLATTPPVLPTWEGFPLVETLTRSFAVPVWMRSSVETMTMGELHAGAGLGRRTMLFVKIGRRIGAGIVCDGQLYRGAQGAAGLIGSLPVTSGGQTGSLDAMAGSDMIQREGMMAATEGRSPLLADILRRGGEVTAIEVSQAAQMGDAASAAILATSGHLIGQVVATLANALNPDLIVLSGSIVQTNDTLLAAVREAVYGASHPLVTRDLRIIRSQMGSSAGLVGAARVASEALFAPHFLKEWVLQGSPQAHPEFAALLSRLKTAPPPPPPAIPPMPPAPPQGKDHPK
ncbi:ROK family protein [Gemmobacter straminiformis]|uniref:ROK family protein n=1 Tax=Paragemmobacter straminiformis TaxID=2045119 RepID=A0A842I6L6_9RHOB|nr:ROK family protein [Gemmobacter straminiformis]